MSRGKSRQEGVDEARSDLELTCDGESLELLAPPFEVFRGGSVACDSGTLADVSARQL